MKEPNALIREWTTCGRCDEVKPYCVCITFKTVHAGYQLTEVCPKCLGELGMVAEMYARDKIEQL